MLSMMSMKSIKRHNCSAVLIFALALTPPVASLMLTGCAKSISKPAQAATDDLSITTRVKTALLNDPEIAGKIDVQTASGVVTLTGTVKTPAERDKAVAIARKVTGVSDVKSSLQVQ
jgi:hyperosmotically inducible periplasmic protein